MEDWQYHSKTNNACFKIWICPRTIKLQFPGDGLHTTALEDLNGNKAKERVFKVAIQ